MPSFTRRFGATRPALAVVFLAALATPFTGVSPAAASPQDQLAQKKAEAAKLEAQISAADDRISILDEQYNQTQLAIDKANEGIRDTQGRLDAAQARTNQLHRELSSRAAALYVGAANGTPVDELDAKDVQEIGSRSKYGSAAANEDDALIGELKVAKEQLAGAQAEFSKSRDKAQAQKAQLHDTRAEIASTQDHQQALLNQTKGQISGLVQKIAAQKAAADQARAKARWQQQVASQRAQAAQSQSSRHSGGSSSDNGGGGGGNCCQSTYVGPPVHAPGSAAQIAVNTAMAQLGKPYVYAASGPNSFDCSGLTMYAWRAAGVSLPHSSAAQYASLPHVSQSQVAPGDLVFFGSPIHHVGIYIGGGQMVSAPHTGTVVKVQSAFRSDYVGAARPG
jgi:cell wall-associated NlpC family hydrolase